MTTTSTPSTAPYEPAVAPAPVAPTRPWLWSVRRELWENRWVYWTPAGLACLLFAGFLLSTFTLPGRLQRLAAADPAAQVRGVSLPFSVVASMLILSTFLTAAFYCAEALHGERRDRSLLFWKSMPVSDLTTVLSKLTVPVLVAPVVAIVATLALQAAMLAVSAVVLARSGAGAGLLFRSLPLVQMPVVMVYGVFVHALWFAPLYAWALFVSAWARRSPLAWVVLPPLALGMAEKVATGSSVVGRFLRWRVLGAMGRAFDPTPGPGPSMLTLAETTPLRFLLSPGLWAGLALTALLVWGAARLRRRLEHA